MPVKFNPFSGQLQIDEKGSGGGSSYIDGEVQNFSALPQTVGSPAVDSAYLVREAEGTWLMNRKPAGIYIRTANTGVRASDWTYAGEFPDVFNDANLVVYNNTDSTKNVKFDASAIATGTTRTLTVPDASGTIQLTGHAASHASSGSDPLFDQDLNTTDLVTFDTVNTQQLNVTGAIDASTASSIQIPAIQNSISIFENGNLYTGTIRVEDDSITANRTYDLPDASGTFALTSDIPALGTGAGEAAEGNHAHGNITNDGKIGSTSGLPVVTTTAGAVTTLALGTANQVLRVNSGASGVEFADPAASGVTGAAASASDVLGVSGANITGVDAGSDKIVFWDDSASELTYLATVGPTFDGTTLRWPVELVIACSDESTNLTTGTAKVTFRAPYAFTLTGVRASVNTAPTGSTLIVDINNGANSALSTKLSIDASEKTSTTAATAAVIDTTYDDISDDAEITIDIDQIGSTVAGKGLKVTLIGTRA